MGKSLTSFEKGNVVEMTDVSYTYTKSLQKGKLNDMSYDNIQKGFSRSFVEMEIGLAPFAPFSKQFTLREEATGPSSVMVLPREEGDVVSGGKGGYGSWFSPARGNARGRRNVYADMVEAGDINLPQTMAAGDGLTGLQGVSTMFGMKLRDMAVSGWRRKTQASFGAHAEVITENIATDIFEEMARTDASFKHNVTADRYLIDPMSEDDHSSVFLNEGLDFSIRTQQERKKMQTIFEALEKEGVSQSTLQQTMGGEETIGGTRFTYEGKSGKLLQKLWVSNSKAELSLSENFNRGAREYVNRMNLALKHFRTELEKAGLKIDSVADLIGQGQYGGTSLISGKFRSNAEDTTLFDTALKLGAPVKSKIDKKTGLPFQEASLFGKHIGASAGLGPLQTQRLFQSQITAELNRFVRRSFDVPILQGINAKYAGKDIMLEQVPISHKMQFADGKIGELLGQGFVFIRLSGATKTIADLHFELVDSVVTTQTRDFGMDMWLLESYINKRGLKTQFLQNAYEVLKKVYFPLLQREYLASEFTPEQMAQFFEPTNSMNIHFRAHVARLMTEKQIADSLRQQMIDGAALGVSAQVTALYNELINEAGDLSETWRKASSSLEGWKGDINRYNYSDDPQSGLNFRAGIWFPGQYWVNDKGFGNAISPFLGVASGVDAASDTFYDRFKARVMDN